MLEPLALAHSVSKAFNQPGGADRIVLDNVDCMIRSNERIALTGPSGSGKSTLLNLLAGLDRPTAGRMSWPALETWEGESGPRPRNVALVFQFASLLPALEVLENVYLPRLLEETSPQQDALRAEAASLLDAFDLGALRRKLPEELSGGQAHRVAMVRALMSHPRLILADEPTGQLDHTTAHKFLDTLLSYLHGRDIALLIATHDADIAARLSGQWQLEHGRLRVIDSMEFNQAEGMPS